MQILIQIKDLPHLRTTLSIGHVSSSEIFIFLSSNLTQNGSRGYDHRVRMPNGPRTSYANLRYTVSIIAKAAEMAIMCKHFVDQRCFQANVRRNVSPSRWEAQADAVNLIFNAKTQSNPESSVGLMSMGGKSPEVLVTLTTDFGKILDGMHRTKISGTTHLATGIQIAGVGQARLILAIGANLKLASLEAPPE